MRTCPPPVRWNQARVDQARHDDKPAHAAIGEMARLLRETRASMLTAGCTLAAIAIGIAQEARFAVRPQAAAVLHAFSIGVMLGTVVCWLTAATLLAVAGRPVLSELSELRWGTGAPLDPRAPWLTLPPAGDHLDQWTWIRGHLLLAAARLARHRMERAAIWSYAAASCFMLWTVLIMTSR